MTDDPSLHESIARALTAEVVAITSRRNETPDVCRFHRELADTMLDTLRAWLTEQQADALLLVDDDLVAGSTTTRPHDTGATPLDAWDRITELEATMRRTLADLDLITRQLRRALGPHDTDA